MDMSEVCVCVCVSKSKCEEPTDVGEMKLIVHWWLQQTHRFESTIQQSVEF